MMAQEAGPAATPLPRRLRGAAAGLVLAATSAFATQAEAEASLTFSTLLIDADQKRYETFGYAAGEVVGSLSSVGAEMARLGHDHLGLQTGTSAQRAIYMATAFQALARFQWASSLVFGHEFSHFATADQLGYTEHYFEDLDTYEKIDVHEAFLRTFLRLDVNGVAVSDHVGTGETRGDRVMSATAGLNWQMNHSEAWLRKALTYAKKDSFDAPEFLLNRAYLTSYAFGDVVRSRDNGILGDVERWSRNMEAKAGVSDAARKAAGWGLAANLLSPGFWSSSGAIGGYITRGNAVVDPFSCSTSLGSLTWDIPQYLNADSMTVAPIAYLTADPSLGSVLGADAVAFGAGLEIPVVGDDPMEARLTATGRWVDLEVDLGIAGSEAGVFVEAAASYSLTENVAFTAGAALAEGDTLRAERNFPFGSTSAWAGLRIRF